MEYNEVLAAQLQEMRRGTIVLSVLSQLKSPQYGYSLVTLLSASGMEVETNTLYPLLRRLESQGLLKSEWETGESKPRKYYRMTEAGMEIYERLKEQWFQTAECMSRLLN